MNNFSATLAWLKEAAANIGNLLGNLFLILLALALFIPLAVIALVWKIYVSCTRENRKAREILSGTGTFFVGIAIALDQLGNVAFGGLFNDTLVKDPKLFPFGKPHETISEVLGWNELLDNLTPLGEKVVALVNYCDFTTKEHCAEAATHGLYDARYKVEYYAALQDKNGVRRNTEKFLADHYN